MRLRQRVFVQFRLALVGAIAAASVATAASKPQSRVEMELVDNAPLNAIEMQTFSPDATRPERRAISDLMLDVWSDKEDMETLLDAPNARTSDAGRSAFRARIIVVIGGKLHTGAKASCGAWELNMAVCDLDCDGGRFGLLRRDGEATSMLRVLIGNLPRDIDMSEKPGFVLSECGVESEDVIRLAPKYSGKPVEFGFVNSPKND
jgi:hypothetical protein